jgi:capsular polysaccharide export protein
VLTGKPVVSPSTMNDTKGKHVLLLQGPSSRFFALVGRSLRQRGARVTRVIFCPGDALYWSRKSGERVVFRGEAPEWAAFLSDFVARLGVTEIVCLGDGRWQHREAIALFEGTDVRVTVIEHGYIRRGWLTVEDGGVGPNSPLPRDPVRILDAARGLPDLPDPGFRSRFLEYAALDVGYHLANLLAGWLLFPHYRRHALDHPVREWAGWIGKGLATRGTRRRIDEVMQRIARERIFLLPLQLETDFQIRLHGPEGGQGPLIDRIIESFAGHAPKDRLLVFKRHPLDNGLTPWRHRVDQAARRFGVAGRCLYLEGGDMAELFARCDGVLTTNSTAGLEAVAQGLPVWMSGDAIYRICGLVQTGELDAFWSNPRRPDPELADAFLRLLKHKALMPGAFDGPGARVGAEVLAESLC